MLEGVVAGRWEGREKEVHADVPSEQFAKVSDYCFVLLGRMLGLPLVVSKFRSDLVKISKFSRVTGAIAGAADTIGHLWQAAVMFKGEWYS
jgi:hypothetical protein